MGETTDDKLINWLKGDVAEVKATVRRIDDRMRSLEIRVAAISAGVSLFIGILLRWAI